MARVEDWHLMLASTLEPLRRPRQLRARYLLLALVVMMITFVGAIVFSE